MVSFFVVRDAWTLWCRFDARGILLEVGQVPCSLEGGDKISFGTFEDSDGSALCHDGVGSERVGDVSVLLLVYPFQRRCTGSVWWRCYTRCLYVAVIRANFQIQIRTHRLPSVGVSVGHLLKIMLGLWRVVSGTGGINDAPVYARHPTLGRARLIRA